MNYSEINFGYGNLHCQKCGIKNIDKNGNVNPCDHLRYMTLSGEIDEPLYDPDHLNQKFKIAGANSKEIIFEEEFFKKNLDYQYTGFLVSEGHPASLQLLAIYKYDF